MRQDTIFSPSFGNRPSQLVGREDVLSSLLAGLQTTPGSRERAVVMLGQRGSGKTVLLWELADQATAAGFAVATPTIAAEGMVGRIVEKIQDAGSRYVSERSARVTGGSVGALGFSAGLQFTRDVQETKSDAYKLTHLCRRLTEKDRGVLVLVDELQANSPEVRSLIATYQELVGEGQNIALVMAGLPGAVSATLNDRVLTFLNRARKVTLEPLGFSEVDAFFLRAFRTLGLAAGDDLRRRASEATEGSPYLLQLVGHNLVLYAADDGTVDEGALESALESARRDFENDICETTLASLSDQDVAFLRAVAAEGGRARMSAVAKRMGVTPDYAQKYRKRLLDAGVIAAPERGRVAIAIPHLTGYLQQG